MYTFSNKLRNLAFTFMVDWISRLSLWFFLVHAKTIEEAKAMVAASHHDAGHGENHATTTAHADEAAHGDEQGAAGHPEEAHDASHDEHVFHQLRISRGPHSMAAFFFL